jgi:hypothetical protein
MLRERGRCLPRLIIYGIGVVCLCVAMNVLGSTMTLWTLQFALDQTDNLILEGFSLPATMSSVDPAMPVAPLGQASSGRRKDVNEHNLLRPPNPTA